MLLMPLRIPQTSKLFWLEPRKARFGCYKIFKVFDSFVVLSELRSFRSIIIRMSGKITVIHSKRLVPRFIFLRNIKFIILRDINKFKKKR